MFRKFKDNHSGCRIETGLEEGKSDSREIRTLFQWSGQEMRVVCGTLLAYPVFKTMPCDHRFLKSYKASKRL